MADLGDFTPEGSTDPDADPDTFMFCGAPFEVPATVGIGSLLRFTWRIKSASEQQRRGTAAEKRAITEEAKAQARAQSGRGELEGSAAIWDLLLSALGEDQIDEFAALADRYGITVDGLLEVCNRIQGAISGRPTKRSPGSSDTPPTSGTASTVNGSGVTDQPPTANQLQRELLAEMNGPADEVVASYA